jgi:hypothetical protein
MYIAVDEVGGSNGEIMVGGVEQSICVFAFSISVGWGAQGKVFSFFLGVSLFLALLSIA